MKIIAAAAFAALLAAAPAHAGPSSEPPALRLVVGERLDICAARLLPACPVSRFICDDPKVATVELAEPGKPAALVGVGPGRTTCAIYGFEGSGRRVLEIAVGRSAGK